MCGFLLFVGGDKKLLLIIKITLILTLLFSIETFASVYSQATNMNVKIEKASFEELIEEISEQSKFKFIYNDEEVSQAQNLSLDFKNATIEEILEKVLSNSDLIFKIVNKTIIITPAQRKVKKIERETIPTEEESQKKSIKGKVVDEKGIPFPGVSIVAKGTTVGVISDIDGNYTLEIPDDTEVLVFSFIGMKTIEEQIGKLAAELTGTFLKWIVS